MKLLVIGALSAALCLAPGLSAQKAVSEQKAAPASQTATQPATESDDATRIITDLGKNDFDVIENKKPQVIQQFTAESDLPLRLAVLVDTSNSIRDQFRFEQQAAIRFIQSVLRPREDRLMLVSFDTAAELVSDLTNDLPKLEAAVKSMRPGGGTSFYDAIYFACKEKLM